MARQDKQNPSLPCHLFEERKVCVGGCGAGVGQTRQSIFAIPTCK